MITTLAGRHKSFSPPSKEEMKKKKMEKKKMEKQRKAETSKSVEKEMGQGRRDVM